ncbi:uncharacterized protein MKK02DRAFT_16995 [Dioszegia hungarica]|uniref:Uncharacterized protein n=1 Tax=Dioszegia hungarica TaxID=4972 RepID=A0AA38LUX2_9TREE|nr:uncharacterized protein MKK02DRAFT_16995 [Dioszegia hungarica]KAI9634531.1 hypothetical protein MKK02DRAFT_16995 [Dioszegia hungarica]
MQAGLRPVLRSMRLTARRANSSTPPTQQNESVQKAVQSAQNALNSTTATLKRVAGPVGERVQNSVGGPIVFSVKTFASMFKQVFKAEKLSFPTDLNTWVHTYAQIWSRATSGKWWTQTVKTGAWAGLGIASIEAYGIFCLGEIIGRRNIVGYKVKDH